MFAAAAGRVLETAALDRALKIPNQFDHETLGWIENKTNEITTEPSYLYLTETIMQIMAKEKRCGFFKTKKYCMTINIQVLWPNMLWYSFG